MVFLAIIAFTGAIAEYNISGETGIWFTNYKQTVYRNSKFYDNDITKAMNSVVEFNQSSAKLDEIQYEFYYQFGDKVLTNVQYYISNRNSKNVKELNDIYGGYFSKFNNNYYVLKDGVWSYGMTGQPYLCYEKRDSNVTAYIGFTQKFYEMKQQNLDKKIKDFHTTMTAAIILAMISLFLLLFLVIVIGKRAEDNEDHLLIIDRIYSEILLIGFIYFIDLELDSLRYNMYCLLREPSIYIPFIILTGIFLMITYSIIRKFKAGIFLKHSLLYQLYNISCRAGKDIYHYVIYGKLIRTSSHTKNLYYRQVIMATATSVIILLTIIFGISQNRIVLLMPFLLGGILYWYIKGNAHVIQKIEKGMEESLQEQLKSERMKIALITNVSHDLKTPLTSIISYIDLLAKEEDLTETATDYVSILQKKSDRLKNIVTDLFELAKSTSGNINIEEELIDLKKLTEQTLADMEDKIQENGLQFKTYLPDSPLVIKSDGRKLYRVLQNIIDNALKYSLKGSRVYIHLEKTEKEAVIIIKNISSYEMNFTQEEILQRFYRGDQSRSTEGSGLGLSIAESFTNNCGGNFEVEIDGDVFKVILTFPVI